jgi:hypothetical protein
MSFFYHSDSGLLADTKTYFYCLKIKSQPFLIFEAHLGFGFLNNIMQHVMSTYYKTTEDELLKIFCMVLLHV